MQTTAFAETQDALSVASLQSQIDSQVSRIMASMPNPQQLSFEQRRGIIARYTAVLEGNFIYWMTGAFLAVRSEEARTIILDNLNEEVRDSHPEMLHRFALTALAAPTDADFAAVNADLTAVRLFIGKMSATKIVATMAFFETLIQRWMPYLAELAALQGSAEREYTDVHGVCDIAHSQGLFNALGVELTMDSQVDGDLLEGVELLSTLIDTINHGTRA